jgi:hypothetical protein
MCDGTAWRVRRSEGATRASRSCLLLHVAEIALFLPYLPNIAVPLATRSVAARLELPRSLGARRSDRLQHRCKVHPAVPEPELPETRPDFYQRACVGPRTPIGSTETDLPPPPKRTRLHLKALIYLQHASHSPLGNVFASSFKNVFSSSTPETPHAPTQRPTSTQPTPTCHPSSWMPYYPTPNPLHSPG